jgi:hypothetical protein
MSCPNQNSILGHNFIAPDTISYRNLYKILPGGNLNIGHYYVLQIHQYVLYIPWILRINLFKPTNPID